MNVLLITLDQFRGDCLSVAGHPVVRTPNLDRLAAAGVRFARHYSQAAPCAPGRACLYTGTYQFNNRVVANGTPLDDRFDNVARAARRAGYTPALFGYTDQALDPWRADGPDDPRLSTYEGVLPGFDAVLDLPEHHGPWLAWLAGLGYDVPSSGVQALATEPERPAEHSVSAFLTDRLLEWIRRQDRPWFAHASYLRPHPPYAPAGHFAAAYHPDEVPLPAAPPTERHPWYDAVLAGGRGVAPTDGGKLRRLRARYYGMISEVDHQLGRVWDELIGLGMWDDTCIVVTADHGEQLGDQGLLGKLGFFEASYHIPCIVRDPRLRAGHGTTVEAFTENVDVFPTICQAMGLEVPAQCDGLPLGPFLEGGQPPWWRDAAHWEFDWREHLIRRGLGPWPWDRRTQSQHLAVVRTADAAYVQFGDGSWWAVDLAADPAWGTPLADPAAVLPLAQRMLVWRSRHTDRALADLLAEHGGVGRWPPVPWR